MKDLSSTIKVKALKLSLFEDDNNGMKVLYSGESFVLL